jgi:DNA-binding TFAR19-related protein (PDSD5 family)
MTHMDMNQIKQAQELEELKRQIISKALTKDAIERLGRVRTVNPNLAGQAELYILQIYQAGKLKSAVTDAQMKEVLRVLAEKKEISIRRK